jgi:hypothetical protein
VTITRKVQGERKEVVQCIRRPGKSLRQGTKGSDKIGTEKVEGTRVVGEDSDGNV